MMETSSRAILCATLDISNGNDDNFVEWHSREHLIERIATPGFLRGRRFSRDDASPKYLIIYDVDDLTSLSGREYVDRLNNPTEWTRATLPTFRGGARGAYKIVSRQGNTQGGYILLLRFLPNNPLSAKRLLGDLITNESRQSIGVTSVYLAEPDLPSSALDTEEAKISGNVVPEEWVFIAEGVTRQHLVEFYQKHICRKEMDEIGSRTIPTPDIFSLQAAVCSESL